MHACYGDDSLAVTGDGSVQWSGQIGTSAHDQIVSLSVDEVGHIHAAGLTTGTFSGYTNSGSYDVFAMELVE